MNFRAVLLACFAFVCAFAALGCRDATRRPSTHGDAGTGMDGGTHGIDSGPVSMCPTMGPENTAAACADGCDNDGNGFADCNDFDCCSVATCGAGTACAPRDGGVI